MINSAIQCVKDAKEISDATAKYGHDGPFCAQCVAEGGLYAIANWPEVKALTNALVKIEGMAGHPDPAQACRNIIKECMVVLEKWEKEIQGGN